MELIITGAFKEYIFDYEVSFQKLAIVKYKRGMKTAINETEADLYNIVIITLIPMSSIRQNDVYYKHIYIYI